MPTPTNTSTTTTEPATPRGNILKALGYNYTMPADVRANILLYALKKYGILVYRDILRLNQNTTNTDKSKSKTGLAEDLEFVSSCFKYIEPNETAVYL